MSHTQKRSMQDEFMDYLDGADDRLSSKDRTSVETTMRVMDHCEDVVIRARKLQAKFDTLHRRMERSYKPSVVQRFARDYRQIRAEVMTTQQTLARFTRLWGRTIAELETPTIQTICLFQAMMGWIQELRYEASRAYASTLEMDRYLTHLRISLTPDPPKPSWIMYRLMEDVYLLFMICDFVIWVWFIWMCWSA